LTERDVVKCRVRVEWVEAQEAEDRAAVALAALAVADLEVREAEDREALAWVREALAEGLVTDRRIADPRCSFITDHRIITTVPTVTVAWDAVCMQSAGSSPPSAW